MIHLEAVYHRASQQFCYALDEEILMVGLQTGEEVEQVWIHYGDPFSTGILGGNETWEGSREEIVTKMRLPKHLWWEIPVQPPYKRCRYFFELQAGAERIFYFEDGFHSPEDVKNGQLGQCFTFPWMNSVDINVTPKWVRDTVWYQIFPERFCNGNKENDPDWVKPWGYHTVSNLDFYGGDLDGIRQKLPYLQELGITGLYLTPVFESPSSHKYDTTDYRKIDPGFGDEETMKLLVKEAHDRGIRVMLDGVFNHCGSNFLPWRDVMEKGPRSPYYDWFMINRWPCREQEGSTRDGRYYSFAFAERMPKLNTSEKKVRDYFLDTVRYWIETFDIDGLRLDVANEISHLFCRELRQMTKQLKPDFYLLGEIWHDAMPWLGGDEFDAVMNYPFAAAIREFWYRPEKTKSDLEEAIHENLVRYMRQTTEVLFNLLDSHDTDRLIHQTGGNQDLFFQQLAMLFTMPGSPCIYYGTEIAIEGGADPDCRRCMPWDQIAQGNYAEVTEQVKHLIALRKEPAARSVEITFENNNSSDRVVEYVKTGAEGSRLRVVLNASGKETDAETKGSVLFARGYENGVLRAGGVLVERL